MPRGLNRSDPNDGGASYRNGTPIDTATHNFGNVVNWAPSPAHFGNPVTQGDDPEQFGNPVDWPTPDPAHFGTLINPRLTSDFELEDGTGVLLLEDGSFLLLEV